MVCCHPCLPGQVGEQVLVGLNYPGIRLGHKNAGLVANHGCCGSWGLLGASEAIPAGCTHKPSGVGPQPVGQLCCIYRTHHICKVVINTYP